MGRLIFIFAILISPMAQSSDSMNMAGEIKHLESEITKLENAIKSQEQGLQDTIAKRKIVENRVTEYQTILSTTTRTIEDRERKIDFRLKSLLVIGQREKEPEAMALTMAIVKRLREEKQTLESLASRRADLEKRLTSLEAESEKLKQIENDLTYLVQQMEMSKSGLAKQYLGRVKEISIPKKLVSAPRPKGWEGQLFDRPLDFEARIERAKRKGVKFHFDKGGQVLAPLEGMILYSGPLSNYGNVVIIDHGNDVRSVLWGDFIPSAKKGQKVSTRQVIGNTISLATSGKLLRELYFEVRKSNEVQDTLALLQ